MEGGLPLIFTTLVQLIYSVVDHFASLGYPVSGRGMIIESPISRGCRTTVTISNPSTMYGNLMLENCSRSERRLILVSYMISQGRLNTEVILRSSSE